MRLIDGRAIAAAITEEVAATVASLTRAGTTPALAVVVPAEAIICQTPLPPGVSLDAVGSHIEPVKDVDGASPVSLGRLAAGLPAYPAGDVDPGGA